MTPNNIVNMAMLNGLDAIAITDHNTVGNVAACMAVGNRIGVLVIPGMELQTREDVHIICLFDSLEKALCFQEIVHASLPKLQNNEQLFGSQLLMDENDNVVGKLEQLLLTSCSLSVDEAFHEVKKLGGVFIPAHIDKNANSIIANLGFIPDYLEIWNLEYRSLENVKRFQLAGLVGEGYRLVKSSDAHYLQDIQMDEYKLECRNRSLQAVIEALNT